PRGPERTGTPRRLCPRRVARRNLRPLAPRDQRAGEVEPRARRRELGHDAAPSIGARRGDGRRRGARVTRAIRLEGHYPAPTAEIDASRGQQFVSFRGRKAAPAGEGIAFQTWIGQRVGRAIAWIGGRV